MFHMRLSVIKTYQSENIPYIYDKTAPIYLNRASRLERNHIYENKSDKMKQAIAELSVELQRRKV